MRLLTFTSVLLIFTAATMGILVALEHWFPKATVFGKVAIVVLATAIIGLTAFCVWQEYRYARKARYAEALPYINQIFFELNKFDNIDNITQSEPLEYTLKGVVNRFAAAISLVTGTMCSVCIKVVTEDDHADPPRPKVLTVVRDDMSFSRERGKALAEESIEDSDESSIDHWVDQNTAFMQVFMQPRSPRACYFSNYLPGEKNYLNTSFQIHGAPPESERAIIRDLNWPLPYKSTIVCPIARQGILRRDYRLAGYFAVDSRSRYVFDRRYDIDLVTGVADCLYSLLYRYAVLVGRLAPGENYEEGENE